MTTGRRTEPKRWVCLFCRRPPFTDKIELHRHIYLRHPQYANAAPRPSGDDEPARINGEAAADT